jgi:predicted DsbA family dithiol-disulfide isomerase
MIEIDVFHDMACPWCRIGKQHLKLALEQWEGEPVEVSYRAFFLNPNIPPEGHDFRSYMRAKGGGQVPLEQFFEAPRRMGTAVGLIFNFEQIERAPNTLLSHRLIALTPGAHREAVIDAIYGAYFEHGRDIGDREVLAAIAAEAGLDAEEMRRALQGNAAQQQVEEEARWAQRQGITGVPFFVFNSRLALSGAQPPEALLRALRQVENQPTEGDDIG